MKRLFAYFLITLIILGICGCSIQKQPSEIGQQQDIQNPEEESKDITISFVGDILLASRVGTMVNQKGVNAPFEKVKDILLGTDYAMGNLESAVAETGEPLKKKYTFRAEPKVLEGLKWSGIDIVTVANNHALDFGREAFVETMEHLNSVGIMCVGGGINAEKAYSPVILEKKGKRIAVLGASRVISDSSWCAGENRPGLAGVYDTKPLINSIKNVRDDVDYVVVYLHWGDERATIPNKHQKNIGKLLIDNGVDVVIGSHPHVLQGFEFYKGKLIAYSLGNFVFTNNPNVSNKTMILEVEFGENGLKSAHIIPCVINNFSPEPIINEAERQKIYDMLKGISFNTDIIEGWLGDISNEGSQN